jgi:ribosomal protein S25
MEKGFYRMINGSLEREKAVEAERDELKDWKREAREVAKEILDKVSHETGRMKVSQDLYFKAKRLAVLAGGDEG